MLIFQKFMHLTLILLFFHYRRTHDSDIKHPRARLLIDKWRHVWLLAMERQRRLQDKYNYLIEVWLIFKYFYCSLFYEEAEFFILCIEFHYSSFIYLIFVEFKIS